MASQVKANLEAILGWDEEGWEVGMPEGRQVLCHHLAGCRAWVSAKSCAEWGAETGWARRRGSSR